MIIEQGVTKQSRLQDAFYREMIPNGQTHTTDSKN